MGIGQQCTKLEGSTKCENWGGLGGYGSPKVTVNVSIR